jgi:hypothetical protein
MNTFRIYEDLRSSLGEEAAKSLAHTLGPMFEELGNTVTKAEFRELTASVDRLAEAQDRTEAQVAKLAEAQARTEAQVFELTKVVQSLVIQGERQGARLDAVLGSTFELQFRDRLTSYLGRLMRRGKLLRNDEVLDAIEQAVEPDEADEVLRVDAIASGIIDGIASHVVVEVSATCGADDIDRTPFRNRCGSGATARFLTRQPDGRSSRCFRGKNVARHSICH